MTSQSQLEAGVDGADSECEVLECDGLEPGILNHLLEFPLSGKLCNALGEVLVRLPVVRHAFAHHWQHVV